MAVSAEAAGRICGQRQKKNEQATVKRLIQEIG